MGCIVRHGSDKQKQDLLPRIARGEIRMQSMAVTEPSTGSDTTKLKTTAVRKGDRYVINGQKVWTSRLQHSDYMLLLARTTPLAEVKKKSEGLSVFLVDLREAVGKSITVRPIRNMVNHETNEIFIDNLEVPVENRIGEEGKGFKYILDGLNAERTLIAAELVFGVSSGQGGLGWYIFENRNTLDTAAVFAGLLSVMAVGLLVEAVIFRIIEARTTDKAAPNRSTAHQSR
jgi:acyl-CoA dehydrogenase